MIAANGAVIVEEDSKSILAFSIKTGMPSPPSLIDCWNICLSFYVIVAPNSDGMDKSVITESTNNCE